MSSLTQRAEIWTEVHITGQVFKLETEFRIVILPLSVGCASWWARAGEGSEHRYQVHFPMQRDLDEYFISSERSWQIWMFKNTSYCKRGQHLLRVDFVGFQPGKIRHCFSFGCCDSPLWFTKSFPFREVGNGSLSQKRWIWPEKDLNQPTNVADDAAYFRFFMYSREIFCSRQVIPNSGAESE